MDNSTSVAGRFYTSKPVYIPDNLPVPERIPHMSFYRVVWALKFPVTAKVALVQLRLILPVCVVVVAAAAVAVVVDLL